MRVLIVEDYEPTRTAVADGLREAGFAVDAAADGDEGLWYAVHNPYDAIILDIMLPGSDGLTVLRRLRERQHEVHVLLLTAKDTVDARVAGLNAGADDYLVKPFDFAELLARVQALVRRAYARKSPLITIADLEIDTARRQVRRGGLAVDLSAREYALLELLARRSGEVVTRSDIIEHLYDFSSDTTSNVVEVFISYLRRKIERTGVPRLLHTRRGHGYVLGVDA